MPVAGAKPKEDRSQIVHRNKPAHDWTEVDNVRFTNPPALRDRSTGGVSVMEVGAANSDTWPEATLMWWRAISTMPHCKLWTDEEWAFAMDSAEIHARTMEAWRGYTGPQLTAREKIMGTTMDFRRNLRIRYVEPKPEGAENELPAGVTDIRTYRDL